MPHSVCAEEIEAVAEFLLQRFDRASGSQEPSRIVLP
jgi:hypothetical protein